MIWYDLRFESTLKVGTTSSIDGLIWFGHLSHRFCDGMAATLEVSCCHCQWHDIEVVLRMDEMEPLPVIPLCVKTIKDVVSDTIKRQGRESKKSQSHGSKAHACCCARQVAGVLRALRHCGGVRRVSFRWQVWHRWHSLIRSYTILIYLISWYDLYLFATPSGRWAPGLRGGWCAPAEIETPMQRARSEWAFRWVQIWAAAAWFWWEVAFRSELLAVLVMLCIVAFK